MNDPKPAPWRIVLSDLDYGPEEQRAAQAVLESKWLSMGGRVRAFEEAFAEMIGVRHAIAVTNGTDALMLALLAAGIRPGDEVIQPALNFVAAANVTVRLGGKPVFADILDLHEPTIDIEHVRRLVSPATRAVIAMHYGGAACRMPPLVELCRERGIALIEDACHGVGAGAPVKMGAWGDIGAFSFFSNKNLATGEGGMLTTSRDDVAGKLRSLRSHGMTTLTWDRHRGHAFTYDVELHGLNCRMDELHAAFGIEQLKKLENNNGRRRQLARLYHAAFVESGLGELGWAIPRLGIEGGHAAHHLMVVLAKDRAARDAAMLRLKKAGIQSSIHYPLIPEFSAFAGYRNADVEKSRVFCNRVLTLPLHPLLADADVREVLHTLAK